MSIYSGVDETKEFAKCFQCWLISSCLYMHSAHSCEICCIACRLKEESEVGWSTLHSKPPQTSMLTAMIYLCCDILVVLSVSAVQKQMVWIFVLNFTFNFQITTCQTEWRCPFYIFNLNKQEVKFKSNDQNNLNPLYDAVKQMSSEVHVWDTTCLPFSTLSHRGFGSTPW